MVNKENIIIVKCILEKEPRKGCGFNFEFGTSRLQ